MVTVGRTNLFYLEKSYPTYICAALALKKHKHLSGTGVALRCKQWGEHRVYFQKEDRVMCMTSSKQIEMTVASWMPINENSWTEKLSRICEDCISCIYRLGKRKLNHLTIAKVTPFHTNRWTGTTSPPFEEWSFLCQAPGLKKLKYFPVPKMISLHTKSGTGIHNPPSIEGIYSFGSKNPSQR